MTKQQTVAPNSRVVTNCDVFCRINEGHLHDLAVLPDREPRVWELKTANIDLFIQLRIITNIQVGCVEKTRRANSYTITQTNLAPADEREKPQANVASDFCLVRANYGAEANSYTAANLVTTRRYNMHLMKDGNQP